MGESISEKEIPKDFIFSISYGKIRVLKTLNTYEEKTVMFLNKGDIFDNYSTSLEFIAYQNTEIISMTKDTVFKDKILKNKYEQFINTANNPNNLLNIPNLNTKYYKELSGTEEIDRNIPLQADKQLPKRNPFKISWYLSLFKKNWFLTGQMILASFITQIFSLGMPVFYIVIFDRVFGRQNISALNVIAVGLTIILMFDLFIKMIRAYLTAHFTEIIDKESIEESVYSFFNIPLDSFNKETAAGLVEKYNEIGKNNQIITNTLLISTMDAAFSLLVVVFLLFLHWKMALISLSPLVPIGISIFCILPHQKKRLFEFNKIQKENQAKILEILENNETIRSLNATKIILKNTIEKISRSFENNFLTRFDQQNSGIFMNFIINIGSLAALYYGAHEVLSGKMTFGVYLAINMLGRGFISSIMKLFLSLQQYQETVLSLNNLKDLFIVEKGTENNQTDLITKTYGKLNISGISFSYNTNSKTVLNNINLEIKPGEKIIVTGKSGSGKTTLVKLLQRLYEPQCGYIALDNINIKNINTENLRSIIGLVHQKNGMFSGTIRNNIIMGDPSVSTDDLLEAIALTKLDETLLKLPEGLDTKVSILGTNLSNALSAQIALTRVLIMKPQILIIDNTLSALDKLLQFNIFNLLIEKFKNNTCIFITDIILIHQTADRIVVLHEGEIKEQGNYQELMLQKNYYFQIYAENILSRQTV